MNYLFICVSNYFVSVNFLFIIVVLDMIISSFFKILWIDERNLFEYSMLHLSNSLKL